MTAPRRRWSFSLRTLFVVVSIGAAVAWYAQRPRYRIYGDHLSSADLRQILEIVRTTPEMNTEPLDSIQVLPPNGAEVETCAKDQYGFGFGHHIELRKSAGKWAIVEAGRWIE